ncbi:MAG: NADH-quinone oxidoreductase subunit NuoE [Acidimicrobiales bacterium]
MPRLTPESVALARQIIPRYPRSRSALIPLLHVAQEQDGWVSPGAMEHLAELLGLEPAEVLGTASFYGMFKLQPVGRYLVDVCTNISCLLLGGEELLSHCERRLGVRAGATTPDGMFTLSDVECVAACTGAPCLQVNYRYFEHMTPEAVDTLLDDLAAGRLDDQVPRHGVLTRVRQGPDVPQTTAAEPTVPAGEVG